MKDFELAKITGNEPPLETEEAQIEELKAENRELRQVIEKAFPFLCAPNPENGFGKACVKEVIKILQPFVGKNAEANPR